MKKGVVLSLFAVLSVLVFSVSAQEKRDSGTDVDNLFGNENKNKYADNWFISVGGSANLLYAEQDNYQPTAKRLKYGGSLDLGKWFNPNFGMRLHGMYGGLRGFNRIPEQGDYDQPGTGSVGFWNTSGSNNLRTILPMGYNRDYDLTQKKLPDGYSGDPDNGWSKFGPSYFKSLMSNGQEGWGFWQEFNYASLTIDLMANLTNLARGRFREDGKGISLIVFGGVGWIHAFNNDLTTPNNDNIVGEIGGRAAYNFNPNWAIFAEPQANLTMSNFDGYVGLRTVDAIFNFTLGVQYTFNRNFDSPIQSLSAEEINYLNDKINNNRGLIEKHQQILERQQDLLDRLNKCCDEKGNEIVTQVLSGKYLPEYIRFTLNSANIQASEDGKLKDAAEFLMSNPGSKLLLIGYADKLTGTPTYNFGLSRKRAEAVANELKRRGVEPSRLILEWRGDKEQPYGPNDWNRVVIMVER